jgi:hypothetical protein
LLLLHCGDRIDDRLAGLTGDQAPRDVLRVGAIIGERVAEDCCVGWIDRGARGVEVRQEAPLGLVRRGELLDVADRDGVLKCAPDVIELALQLGGELDPREIALLDRDELALDPPAEDRPRASPGT